MYFFLPSQGEMEVQSRDIIRILIEVVACLIKGYIYVNNFTRQSL